MSISRKGLPLLAGTFFCLFVSTLPLSPSFAGAPIYTYTDDAGILTFTTEWDSIPEKYRDRLVRRKAGPASASSALPASAPSVSVEPRVPSADVRTVRAAGEYRMGDHDTRTDALRLALEAAKKDALEQVATYLESVTEVRNMDVTRDDIRSYTAGIVNVGKQAITTRLEDGMVVVRADLTAEIDPHEVTQAIAALRENESAKQELLALRAETDRLQEELDVTNRALSAAPSLDEVQQLSRRREDMLKELQANGLVSQAWTSVVYATLGYYSHPGIGLSGINGLLLQAQRLHPRHRHLPLAQQIITAKPGQVPTTVPGIMSRPPHHSLPVPSAPHVHTSQPPQLLTPQGLPAKVGDVVVIPTPRSVPPLTQQSASQPQQYQLHPSHFWRPSPPNIHNVPSASPPSASVNAGRFDGQGRRFGGAGHRGR
ncbi:MAG: exported protein of unknown function [Nitrospira sp.]|jgi:hypothetical protein|nr:exported protein of unknown function [Nitrospira sp.]